jgi:hypothetical protein
MTRLALLAIALVIAAALVNYYIPLQPAVVAAYAGIGMVLIGGVSILKPLKFLGIRRRLRAAMLTAAGIAVTAAALLWPAATLTAAGPRQRIDDFMPAYSFYERHETRVQATPEQVSRAVKAARFSDLPVAAALMRVRAMASGRFDPPPPSPKPILEIFATPGTGFLPLDATREGEYVGGMVGRPWVTERPPRVETPEQFLAFDRPGYVKVAFNIRWVDSGGGFTRLTTETRCQGTSAEATRIFARYWRVIYPGSAIIRRSWLNAIERLAVSS